MLKLTMQRERKLLALPIMDFKTHTYVVQVTKRHGTFQQTMDTTHFKVRYIFALVYLDSIVIFSSLLQEHISHVRTVLIFLREADVTLKLRRCRFVT